MSLATPSLSFSALPSHDLAEIIAIRLRRPSIAVLDVVRLRLHALDVAFSLNSIDLLVDQRSWEAARLLADGGKVDPGDIDEVLLDVLADSGVDAGVLAELGRLQGATSTTLVRLFGPSMDADGNEPLSALAHAYLDAALASRRDEALAIVSNAVAGGLEPSEVMLTVLQPAQLELGRLWSRGEITVAHEHYVTALTQSCMALLYPTVPSQRSPDAPRMVALTIGAEGHELGMRMVSDLMRHEGWDLAYLGADVPTRDVVSFTAATKPHVLAISVTMAGNVLGVRSLIAEVREDPDCAGVHILVGGRPFALNPRLQALVDADGWAPGPREALQLCWLWVQRSVPTQSPRRES